MNNAPYRAVQICKDVYWVGAIDWGLRDFHGYTTSRGSTYNAYLVMAEKITLIDAVKAPFRDEMMSRIASIVDPSMINYVVSHHAEMDHSGSLPDVIEYTKPERIFASIPAVDALKRHFHWDVEITTVKDGETISLGNMDLTFVETKMLHWPESIVSFLHERKLLFSQDIFGMHLSGNQLFADEVNPEVLYFEAAKYYANIVLPYSPLVTRLLKKVEGMNLGIEMIAPDHGPIWRQEPYSIVEWYGKWAEQKPTNKVVIVYDTMWQSTAKMARAIADGATSAGAEVKVMPMHASNRSDVATEILEAGAIVVGSPTINNNLFPTLADVMTYLKGLKPRNLVGAAFGSFGWSGEAVKQLEGVLNDMGVEIVAPSINIKYIPDDKTLLDCRMLGEKVASSIRSC